MTWNRMDYNVLCGPSHDMKQNGLQRSLWPVTWHETEWITTFFVARHMTWNRMDYNVLCGPSHDMKQNGLQRSLWPVTWHETDWITTFFVARHMTWNRMDYNVLCGPLHVMGQTKLQFLCGRSHVLGQTEYYVCGLSYCIRKTEVLHGPYDNIQNMLKIITFDIEK